MTIFGIDISHHQGSIDLTQVALENNLSFAMAKMSEGDGFTDREFLRHATEAKQAGLLFAGYHFLRGDVGVVNQVQHVKRLVGDSGIPVIIDIERTNGSPQPTMTTVNAFYRAAEVAGVVVSPLLYLPEWYWAEIGRPMTAGWAIWQSRYGPNDGVYPGDTSDRWSAMGRAVSVLQFTSAGRLDGYSGDLDVDAFRGTRGELANQGWFIDYKEDEVATKEEIQAWVASTPIVVDGAGTKEPLQKVLRQILTGATRPFPSPGSPGASASEIAALVVASLPPDEELTRADVKAAVSSLFVEKFGA